MDGKPGDEPKAEMPPGPKADDKSQGEGKGESKQAKGQPGGEGKPQEGKPSDSQQAKASESKGGGSPPKPGGKPGQPGGGQPGGEQQAKEQTPGREQVEEAYPHQKAAEDDLKKNDRPNAGKNEDEAIKQLAKAIEELEKRLKQLREEEMLKLLADLEARTNRMLAMQIEVYEATKAIDGTIQANMERTNAEVQKSQQQSDKEGQIVLEANTSLKLLESEGTAVAFARVLEEVRQDMIFVQRRLYETRVDADTQAIEQNIIALLKDMADALKKAQQEIKEQKDKPPGDQPPGEQKPQDRKLIDLLAELKLIRSLQLQVNSRTKIYGEQAGPDKPRDPLVEAELRQLSARQDKLEGMIHDIATGSNR